jgi:hypothetical protein
MRRFLITGIALCCFAIAAPAFAGPSAALPYSTQQTQTKSKNKNNKKMKAKSMKTAKKSGKSGKSSKKKS